MIEVYSCGTKVEICDGEIIATVNSINICGKNIRYEVSWWNGREYKEKWLDSRHVSWHEGAKQEKIGFRKA